MSAYAARRTPVHRGPAAWSAILPGQPAPVPLAGDTSADFALVGGGFVGLSAAQRLLQLHPGAKIVVLEAGRLAEGAPPGHPRQSAPTPTCAGRSGAPGGSEGEGGTRRARFTPPSTLPDCAPMEEGAW